MIALVLAASLGFRLEPERVPFVLVKGGVEGIEGEIEPAARVRVAECRTSAGDDLRERAICAAPVLRRLVMSETRGPLSVGIGKDVVSQGGFEAQDARPEALVTSYYLERVAPFARWQPLAFARYEGVTLQVTDDATGEFPGRGSFNEEPLQPAWTLAWENRSLRVQAAPYDINHSVYVTAGYRRGTTMYLASAAVTADSRETRRLGEKTRTVLLAGDARLDLRLTPKHALRAFASGCRCEGWHPRDELVLEQSLGLLKLFFGGVRGDAGWRARLGVTGAAVF